MDHKIDTENIDLNVVHLPDADELEDDILSDEKPKNKFLGWILRIAKEVNTEVQNDSNDATLSLNPYFSDALEEDIVHFYLDYRFVEIS